MKKVQFGVSEHVFNIIANLIIELNAIVIVDSLKNRFSIELTIGFSREQLFFYLSRTIKYNYTILSTLINFCILLSTEILDLFQNII